jgi:hypothetical protein
LTTSMPLISGQFVIMCTQSQIKINSSVIQKTNALIALAISIRLISCEFVKMSF